MGLFDSAGASNPLISALRNSSGGQGALNGLNNSFAAEVQNSGMNASDFAQTPAGMAYQQQVLAALSGLTNGGAIDRQMTMAQGQVGNSPLGQMAQDRVNALRSRRDQLLGTGPQTVQTPWAVTQQNGQLVMPTHDHGGVQPGGGPSPSPSPAPTPGPVPQDGPAPAPTPTPTPDPGPSNTGPDLPPPPPPQQTAPPVPQEGGAGGGGHWEMGPGGNTVFVPDGTNAPAQQQGHWEMSRTGDIVFVPG